MMRHGQGCCTCNTRRASEQLARFLQHFFMFLAVSGAAQCILGSVAADDSSEFDGSCVWVLQGVEGVTMRSALLPLWDQKLCPLELVHVAPVGDLLQGFLTPVSRAVVVQYTPPPSGLQEHKMRHVSQFLNITCGGLTPLCRQAVVHYAVRGSSSVGGASYAKKGPSRDLSGKVEACPEHGFLSVVDATAENPTRVNFSHQIKGCPPSGHLTLNILPVSGNQSGGFTVVNDNVLLLHNGGRLIGGNQHTVNVSVYCDDIPLCTNARVTVLKKNQDELLASKIALQRCSRAYRLRMSAYGEKQRHIQLWSSRRWCKAGQSAAFTLWSRPRYNPQEFYLDPRTGAFNYSIPPYTSNVAVDDFAALVECINDVNDIIESACVVRADIIIDPTPRSRANTSVVLAHKRVNNPSTGLAIGRNNTLQFWPGVSRGLRNHNAQFSNRTFSRSRDTFSANEKTDRPSGDDASRGMYSTYELGNIVCRGTCVGSEWRSNSQHPHVFNVTSGSDGSGSHASSSHGGGSPAEMSFEISKDGKYLRIRSFTTMGNMEASFVTFEPLWGMTGGDVADGKTLFSSISVPSGANPSFNTACVNHHMKHGLETDILRSVDVEDATEDSHTQSDARVEGNEYFRGFGGNHRDCDTYRNNPCRYAPLLTPANATIGETGAVGDVNQNAQWKLFINGCGATWVGEIPVTQLLQLRSSYSGEPLFTLKDNTVLVGSVYSQVVKPSSAKSPKGYVSTHRKYDIYLPLRNAVSADIKSSGGSDLHPEELGKRSSSRKQGEDQLTEGSFAVLSATKGDNVVKKPRIVFDRVGVVRFSSVADANTGTRTHVYTLLLSAVGQPAASTADSLRADCRDSGAAPLRIVKVELVNTLPGSRNCTCEGCCDNETDYNGTEGSDRPHVYDLVWHEGGVTVAKTLEECSGKKGSATHTFNVSFTVRLVVDSSLLTTREVPQGTITLRVHFDYGRSAFIDLHHHPQLMSVASLRVKYCQLRPRLQIPHRAAGAPFATKIRAKRLLEDVISEHLKMKEYACNQRGNCTHVEPDGNKPQAQSADAEWQRVYPMGDVVNIGSARCSLGECGGNNLLNLCSGVCTAGRIHQFGLTDLVYVTLEGSGASDTAPPISKMSLQCLLLSVKEQEVISGSNAQSVGTGEKERKLHFLLDGDHISSGRCLGDGYGTNLSSPLRYLDRQTYASFLRYQRIDKYPCAQQKSGEPCLANGIGFAFAPGTLLRENASQYVEYQIEAVVSIAFEGMNIETLRTEKLSFLVETSPQNREFLHIPSTDTNSSVSNTTKFVTISKTMASVLYITLSAVIAVLVSLGLVIEWRFKRMVKTLSDRDTETSLNGCDAQLSGT
uniref:Uncharacterized protein TCIL3000_10_12330 n=1 Tax=Trypanosoma congolense (strain IL3000) TaxID=1068625 RepID=G0UYI4_TRYCI|nr:unnamed protein product [Trypanosoma congolense IL3000]